MINQEIDEKFAMDRLMGLVVFGEKMAARNYSLMANLRPEFADTLRHFAKMEATHSTWFRKICKDNGFDSDRAFAEQHISYLVDQVDDYNGKGDFDALAMIQGFIVESLGIATYEPFLKIAHRYGAYDVLQATVRDELHHVDWITRYFRLRFFDQIDEFVSLSNRVNVEGIDCVGGTLFSVIDYLEKIGLSGSDCSGLMMNNYMQMLEDVGVSAEQSLSTVMANFMPLMEKFKKDVVASETSTDPITTP